MRKEGNDRSSDLFKTERGNLRDHTRRSGLMVVIEDPSRVLIARSCRHLARSMQSALKNKNSAQRGSKLIYKFLFRTTAPRNSEKFAEGANLFNSPHFRQSKSFANEERNRNELERNLEGLAGGARWRRWRGRSKEISEIAHAESILAARESKRGEKYQG